VSRPKNHLAAACLILGLSALGLLALSCDRASKPTEPNSTSSTLPSGTQSTVVLRPGESTRVANVTVTFERIVMESRCPRGVVCAVAGIVEAELSVRATLGTNRIVLSLMGEQAENDFNAPTVSALGHTFRIQRLDPYPDIQVPQQDRDYVLTLTID
jgi:hypothetical protein